MTLSMSLDQLEDVIAIWEKQDRQPCTGTYTRAGGERVCLVTALLLDAGVSISAVLTAVRHDSLPGHQPFDDWAAPLLGVDRSWLGNVIAGFDGIGFDLSLDAVAEAIGTEIDGSVEGLHPGMVFGYGVRQALIERGLLPPPSPFMLGEGSCNVTT